VAHCKARVMIMVLTPDFPMKQESAGDLPHVKYYNFQTLSPDDATCT